MISPSAAFRTKKYKKLSEKNLQTLKKDKDLIPGKSISTLPVYGQFIS